MRELTHGINFLIDFYVLVGVARDADLSVVRSAFRVKLLAYHPDRFQGLSTELLNQAKYMTRVLTEGMQEFFENDETRATYNAKLDSWKGPISTDGHPVIDMNKPEYSGRGLLAGEAIDADIETQIDRIADSMAPYNHATFELLEEQFHATEKPSEKLQRAYAEALAAKDLHLAMREELAWKRIGVQNAEEAGRTPRAHLEYVEAKLEDARSRITETVERTIALVQGGEVKLLTGGSPELEEKLKADPEKAIAEWRGNVEEQFAKLASRMQELGEARASVVDERFKLLKAEYRPQQKTRFPRVLLGVQGPKSVFWFEFEIEDEVVRTAETVSREEREQLTDTGKAEELIRRGYNVMFFTPMSDYDINEQLEAAVCPHYEALEEGKIDIEN